MSPRLVQWIASLLCVGLVWCSSRLVSPINEGRRSLNMYGGEVVETRVAPEYALAIQALGAFRGLITDIAFIRAEQFKQEGRFYDAAQLADWICKLQPHFPSVWEFQAWNMAWNISVTTYTPEERWNWVYNGVRLIRDQGIPNNPRALNLYRQIAWIYNNKMSESVDDQNMAYKCYWAYRMHILLGPPRPVPGAAPASAPAERDLLRDAAETIERIRNEQMGRAGKPLVKSAESESAADPAALMPTPRELATRSEYAFIKAIADAPRTLEELYAADPATRDLATALRSAGVRLSDDALTDDVYWRDDGLAFTFFEPYRALKQPVALLDRVARGQVTQSPEQVTQRFRRERLDGILQIRAGNESAERLVRFLQRKVLAEVYKMDPAHMAYLVSKYGPIDWRSVDGTALYWITKGMIECAATLTTSQNDKVNADRILFYSLRNLFLRNHLTFEPYPDYTKVYLSYINPTPDENFIESMHQAFIELGPHLDPEAEAGGAGGTFRTAHVNFLGEAIRMLFLADRTAEAQKYFEYMQVHYSKNEDGSPNTNIDRTLAEFAMENYYDVGDSPGTREMMIVMGAKLGIVYNQLAEGGSDERVRRLMAEVKRIYDEYQKDKTIGNKLMLPPFEEIMIDVFGTWLGRPSPSHVATLHKVRLWAVADNWLKQAVYDVLKPQFDAECEAWQFDVEKAFPEPAGMEEYRKSDKARERAVPEDNTTTIPQAG